MAIPPKKKSYVYADPVKKAEQAATGKGSKAYRIPEGMSYYAPKKAQIDRLIIAPYLCGGRNNPYAKKGQVWYERTYYAHRGIGPDSDTFLCARKTLGTRCPICDYIQKAKSIPSTNPKLLQELEPKDRQLFIIKDLAEPQKGWRIFDMSFHLFGKALDAKVKMADAEDAHYRKFFYPKGGSVIKVSWKEKKYTSYSYYEQESIDIRLRGKELDLSEDILDTLPCLDDLLVETPYAKLEKIFKQGTLPGQEDEDGGEEEGAGVADTEDSDDDDTSDGEDDTDSDDDGDSGDAETDDDDGDEASEEEEEESEDSESEDDESSDDDLPEFKVGDRVSFDYRGKTLKGKVVKVVSARNLLHVDAGLKNISVVRMDEATIIPKVKDALAKPVKKKSKPVDEEPEEEVEDEDNLEVEDEEEPEEEEEPTPKKKAKSKSRAFTEPEEEDEDFNVEDDEPAPPKKKLKPKK